MLLEYALYLGLRRRG